MRDRNDKWEKIGTIGVDAGLCWVGDPCYILHKSKEEKPKEIGKDWRGFCRILEEKKFAGERAASFGYLGAVVSTGWGDGAYDVFVKRDERTGGVAELKVVFMEDEEEEG